MNVMAGSVIKKTRDRLPKSMNRSSSLLAFQRMNYHDVKKGIVDRNIFNSEGKVPDEKEVRKVEETADNDSFDINGPCRDSSLNVSLVGTIFFGSRFTSYAVVKEKGYTQSDVYGVGDEIIGQEQAVIAAVDQQSVIINNSGVKECLELDQPVAPSDPYASSSAPPIEKKPNKDAKAGGSVTLAMSDLEKEAGDGGEGLLNAGRIVPVNDPETNQMMGFKLISVAPGKIFARIGLSNGDVITQVNDTSLKEPEKGFVFYQAFQDETEIKISFLRDGKQPKTINVTIK